MSQHQQPFISFLRKRAIIQWLVAIAVSFSTSVLFVACGKADALSGQKTPVAAHQAAPKPRKAIPTMSFTKGMAYADLRTLATKQGWTPVVDAQCKSNVMGSNYQQLCSSDPGSTLCTACDISPELSGCSGDGYCGMYFSKGGMTLHVVTYGMIEDLKVTGQTSRLYVDAWDVSRQP